MSAVYQAWINLFLVFRVEAPIDSSLILAPGCWKQFCNFPALIVQEMVGAVLFLPAVQPLSAAPTNIEVSYGPKPIINYISFWPTLGGPLFLVCIYIYIYVY